jgi:hypothetical protein
MLSERETDWGMIYAALIHAIKTNSGIGFKNSDQGHMPYVLGAQDGRRNCIELGDSPENNRLYKMLLALSPEYGARHGVRIQNWRAFCQLAVESHEKAQSTASAGE